MRLPFATPIYVLMLAIAIGCLAAAATAQDASLCSYRL